MTGEEALSHAPLGAVEWAAVPGMVRHTFTHFHLELEVRRATCGGRGEGQVRADGRWVAPGELDAIALPTVMKKVCRLAMETDG